MKILGNGLYESDSGIPVMIVDMSENKEKGLKSYYSHIQFENGYYAFYSEMLSPIGPAETVEKTMGLFDNYISEK